MEGKRYAIVSPFAIQVVRNVTGGGLWSAYPLECGSVLPLSRRPSDRRGL